MISLLLPSRGRPRELQRMIESVRSTAVNEIEIIVRFDDDDQKSIIATQLSGIKILVGPRLREITKYWNECFDACHGDIVAQMNDDVIFRTPGWDVTIENAFAECPDQILMVHGNDLGGQRDKFGPHPFVSRKWIETLGYFIAPYFSSDYGDTFINDLANALGRRKYLPFVIEHMHFIWGKAEVDQTTRERLERHDADNPQMLYDALAAIRDIDAGKLRAVMNGIQQPDPKLSIMILTQPSRATFLARLLARLRPQIADYPDVAIDIRIFDRGLSLGANREAMRQAARGRYLVFIDDDDLIAEDYIAKIYPLLDGVDQIGFQVQCYIDGQPLSKTYHSLKYPCWTSDKNGHYRDISHINPMRRELALKVPMEGGTGEDSRWSDAMRELKIVKTEHYIDLIMYFYYFRNSKADAYTPMQILIHNEEKRGFRYPVCPKCKSTATGLAGGMRRCNQCGAAWI